MTLQDFHDRLAQASPDARVVFATDEGRISAGYHVTEFKLAQIQSIDCGATPSQWTEASFQLLDGRGGEHMTAQKFQAILTRSAAILPGLLVVLRLNLFGAWMVVLIAEATGVGYGLGQVIMLARNTFNPGLVFFTIVLIGCTGFLFDYGLRMLQTRILYWVPKGQGSLG